MTWDLSKPKLSKAMVRKNVCFDANSVKIDAGAHHYVCVEVETDYADEILANFSAKEIIENYADLDKLYEALKGHFEGS